MLLRVNKSFSRTERKNDSLHQQRRTCNTHWGSVCPDIPECSTTRWRIEACLGCTRWTIANELLRVDERWRSVEFEHFKIRYERALIQIYLILQQNSKRYTSFSIAHIVIVGNGINLKIPLAKSHTQSFLNLLQKVTNWKRKFLLIVMFPGKTWVMREKSPMEMVNVDDEYHQNNIAETIKKLKNSWTEWQRTEESWKRRSKRNQNKNLINFLDSLEAKYIVITIERRRTIVSRNRRTEKKSEGMEKMNWTSLWKHCYVT